MEYSFVKTADGSVGLYENNVKDIFHSSSGAYKEALEKFVIPAQLERFKNNTCKVLDICYGIGYNTKALLKYSLKNNLNIKFQIDALEINKELIEISPFIKNYKNEILDFEIDKFILMSFLKDNKIDFHKLKTIIRKNSAFLTTNKTGFNKILENCGYNYEVLEKINTFLHNIYYHNMAKRHLKGQKFYNFEEIRLKWHINDARNSVLELNNKYDLIFLDAFTASKQPILWTNRFIKLLSERLNTETGLIISYSTSSPYRKALINSGLKIGKFYTEKVNGTLATYNEFLLKYKLDDFETGLLNTRAGIPYEDISLHDISENILKSREYKVKSSDLESTSSYYRRYNRKHGK